MRLDMVMIHVDDMSRMSAFASAILGAEPAFSSPHFSAWELENTRLCLHSSPEAPGPGPVLACLQTEDLEAFARRAEAAGAAVIGQQHETPRGPVISFQDPEGNPWQAIQIK